MVVEIYNLVRLYKPRYTYLHVTCLLYQSQLVSGLRNQCFISNKVLLSMPHVSNCNDHHHSHIINPTPLKCGQLYSNGVWLGVDLKTETKTHI